VRIYFLHVGYRIGLNKYTSTKIAISKSGDDVFFTEFSTVTARLVYINVINIMKFNEHV